MEHYLAFSNFDFFSEPDDQPAALVVTFKTYIEKLSRGIGVQAGQNQFRVARAPAVVVLNDPGREYAHPAQRVQVHRYWVQAAGSE